MIKENSEFIRHIVEMVFRDGFIRGRMYTREMPALQEIAGMLAIAKER